MPAEAVNPGWLGFITFSIVIGSLFLIILAAILVKPRKSKVTLVFIGMIFALVTAFVGFSWLFGKFLSILFFT